MWSVDRYFLCNVCVLGILIIDHDWFVLHMLSYKYCRLFYITHIFHSLMFGSVVWFALGVAILL